MRRHVIGAVLIGLGGFVARHRPGLTGLSTLSIAALIAVLAMVVGARVGLGWLVEGRRFYVRRA